MKVSEFMTKEVISIPSGHTVEDAAKLMLDKNISTLPIVDSQAHLVGILTESDFIGQDANIPHALASIKKVLGQIFYNDDVEDLYRRVKDCPLEKVMTRNPHTVTPDHSLSDVVSLMNSYELKRIPVIENQKLIGMITLHDVIRAFTMISSSKNTQEASF